MFGYVKPYTPELKMREYEAYRGLYCGLCRAMGRVTGQTSRLTLNYEFVFLTAVRMLLAGVTPEYKKGRCAVHPVKARSIAAFCPETEYAAAVSALLASGKAQDDRFDEKGLKRLCAVLVTPYFSAISRRAGHALGETSEESASVVAESLFEVRTLEEQGCESVDLLAEAFGKLTSHIFAAGFDGAEARIAREVGRGTGRFIYVADALDDLVSDVKKGSFNPIAALYGDSATVKREGKVYLSEEVAASVVTGAYLELDRLAHAVELACDMGERTLGAIVKNTVYLGMPKVLEDIVSRRTGKSEKK